jgi:hypothetical protein
MLKLNKHTFYLNKITFVIPGEVTKGVPCILISAHWLSQKNSPSETEKITQRLNLANISVIFLSVVV